MPWLETVPVEQRARFIDDHRLGLYDMTELCTRYAISRKTGLCAFRGPIRTFAELTDPTA